MKMNFKTFVLIISAAFFTSSCTNMLYTKLDVLRPAKVAFATDANNLLIVNNTVNQPEDYGHKTELLNEKPKNVLVVTDSMSFFCINAMTEEMKEKGFFKKVSVLPKSINKGTDFFKTNTLSKETVVTLCNANESNVVLSLDRMKVSDKITEYFSGETYMYYALLEAHFETTWSIHYPNKIGSQSITLKDTLFWESEMLNRMKNLLNLPKRWDAIVDGALFVGKNSINKFVPYWDKSERYFFVTKNKKISEGLDSVSVKNWDAAIKVWETALSSKSVTTKAKIHNNIAIAYEVLGNIEKAQENINKSLEYINASPVFNQKDFNFILNYKNVISKRIKEMEILDKQLGN